MCIFSNCDDTNTHTMLNTKLLNRTIQSRMHIFMENNLFQARNITLKNNERNVGHYLFAGRVGFHQLECPHHTDVCVMCQVFCVFIAAIRISLPVFDDGVGIIWRPSSPESDGTGLGTCCARTPTPSPKLQPTGPKRESGSVVDRRQSGEELWKRK